VEILILLIFVSLVFVTAAVGLFLWTVRQRTFDHADRLALLPLADEATNATDPDHE
jgi:cbb3-type cytochrome oxidase maturation protein